MWGDGDWVWVPVQRQQVVQTPAAMQSVDVCVYKDAQRDRLSCITSLALDLAESLALCITCVMSLYAGTQLYCVYGTNDIGHRHTALLPASEQQEPHHCVGVCAGVVYATKPHAEVLGVARLLDEAHHLEAVISFGPVPGTRQRMLARTDAVCGEIYQLPKSAHLQVRPGLCACA